jgi:hypothetical protein
VFYADGDGDGIARQGAAQQEACEAPDGHVAAADVDGDGTSDWDCNDANPSIHPGAAAVCGDGIDNDCDGHVDRLCFSACPGQWPFRLAHSSANLLVSAADLDGDGKHEVMVQNTFGFAILDLLGRPLHEYSAPQHNYSRGRVALADVDDHATFGPEVQTLEVLTGNGNAPRFYKLGAGKAVSIIESTTRVYDASRFMVFDVDRDGAPEFFTTSWCDPTAGTRVFRLDRGSGSIVHVRDLPDPEGGCEYTAGRSLTDLDGDGTSELVFGTGYYQGRDFAGRIYARRLSGSALVATPYCADGLCFATQVVPWYSAETRDLFRIGNTLRSRVQYTQEENPADLSRGSALITLVYGLNGARHSAVLEEPAPAPQALYQGLSDVDRDGIADDRSEVLSLGLYDVNGDGFPDRIYGDGQQLKLDLWRRASASYQESIGSALDAGRIQSVQWIWDLDRDGRLEVLVADEFRDVHCHRLGAATWNRDGVVPPHIPLFHRTYQFDNHEPNEGRDLTGDGLPDEYIRIPSALTATGEFYGYLSTPEDRDYYLINSDYSGNLCVTAPLGQAYTVSVYSLTDRKNNQSGASGADGIADGLIWRDDSDRRDKCLTAGAAPFSRSGEYRFIVGIESRHGSHSPHYPYWIRAPK